MTEIGAFARGIAAAASVELRRFARIRTAVVMTFLTPVAIASIVVFALGSTDEAAAPAIGWVASADDPSVDQFVEEVVDGDELSGAVEWVRLEPGTDVADAVAHGDAGAAIVIGPAVVRGGPAQLTVIGAEDPIAAGVAATIADEYRVGHAAAVLAFSSGQPLPERGAALTLAIVAPRGASLDAATYWGPALGAFLILLAMGSAAQRHVEDRRRGVAGRLRSTVTSPAAVTLGRSLAASGIGTVALLVMAAAMALLFGRAWGPWPQIVAVAAATALAVAGVGTVIAALSRTPSQAQTTTAVVAFGLAIGGGSFNPPGTGGEPSGLTRWLPTTLSLDAFSIAATTGAVADLLAPTLALAATGVLLFGVSGLVHREVRP